MMGNMVDDFNSCNTGHFGDHTVEQANYMGNQFQGRKANNPYSNTYNLGWHNHPNFSWSNNNDMTAPHNMAKAQGPSDFQQPQQDRIASIENKLDKFFDAISTKITSQDEN